MPVIQITGWPIADGAKAQALLEEVTAAMHRTTGVPLDKITAYLIEVEPRRWADAGVLGSDKEFAVKSRRMTYDDDSNREK